jgi:hypothetical protein
MPLVLGLDLYVKYDFSICSDRIGPIYSLREIFHIQYTLLEIWDHLLHEAWPAY